MDPFETPPRTEKEQKQLDCEACLPKFDGDEVRRLRMSSSAIRKKYPRFSGTCLTCGYSGIKYACYEQYIFGDY
jgi:hypothetical protein